MNGKADAGGNPFTPLSRRLPVTVVTTGELPAGAVAITLSPPLHEHAPGAECAACAARGDIRAMLFDLLIEIRDGRRPMPADVVVDARALPDPQPVVDQLTPGKTPALGLRDRTVAHSFKLTGGDI